MRGSVVCVCVVCVYVVGGSICVDENMWMIHHDPFKRCVYRVCVCVCICVCVCVNLVLFCFPCTGRFVWTIRVALAIRTAIPTHCAPTGRAMATISTVGCGSF